VSPGTLGDFILLGIVFLWLLKIPNAPKSLEFLDSPTQYRRHAYARAVDRFSACMPIP
jgi:hypothetical protein